MKSGGVIIIIHPHVSLVLLHHFLYTFDSKTMSAFILFMRKWKAVFIIRRFASAGIYHDNHSKKRVFLLLNGKLNKSIGDAPGSLHRIIQ